MSDFFDTMSGVLSTNSYEVIAVIAAIMLLLMFTSFFERAVFAIYNRCANPVIQLLLKKAIYELDEFADDMEITEKREILVAKLQEWLSFGVLKIPAFAARWIITLQVKQIRHLQATSTKETNLHK